MSSYMHTERESPLACNMSAIEPGQREQHIETAKQLFRAVTDIQELPNGYAFRLSDEPGVLVKVAEFIVLERLCCPFFGFALEVEPEGGAIWLRLTGRESVKPFIRAETGEFMGTTITKLVGFRPLA